MIEQAEAEKMASPVLPTSTATSIAPSHRRAPHIASLGRGV
jgi:hypothetical protein